MFNSAFKEINGNGDSTDFAQLDFSRICQKPMSMVLLKSMGKKNLYKVKRCEFHFRDLINRKASILVKRRSKFNEISLSMLISTTPEAYINALKNMQDFINKGEKLSDLKYWFNCWYNRRELIFKAVTSKVTPESNLAEIIHAGWKSRDKIGVSLPESCLFNVRDSLLLEPRVASLSMEASKADVGQIKKK